MRTLIALLLSTSMSWAGTPKQVEIDALALISLGPNMCNLDTEAWWKEEMIKTSIKHDIGMSRLIRLVKKARRELKTGFESHPKEAHQGCGMLRR